MGLILLRSSSNSNNYQWKEVSQVDHSCIIRLLSSHHLTTRKDSNSNNHHSKVSCSKVRRHLIITIIRLCKVLEACSQHHHHNTINLHINRCNKSQEATHRICKATCRSSNYSSNSNQVFFNRSHLSHRR